LKDGNYVICVDNFDSSSPISLEKLQELGGSNFEFIKHDIVQPLTLDPKTLDQIYNLACPASPPHYQRDPVKTMQTAFNGLLNLLEMARAADIPILQASTSEVYGDPKVHPQPETYWGHVSCTGIRACYDEGKRIGETLMFEFHRQYKTKIRVIRIFNTYGPFMHPYDGRVVSNFIRQALEGKDITIYGDGSQTRSFQYCEDLVEGIVRMMNNTTGFIGPVNLGNPNEFTIKQLAELVLELTKSKSQIVYKEAVADDPTVRRPMIDVAQKELNGWEPKVQLREGLQNTIEYFSGVDLSKFHDALSAHLAKAQT
jgi:UDP-glucuronate decarboxylase